MSDSYNNRYNNLIPRSTDTTLQNSNNNNRNNWETNDSRGFFFVKLL